MNQLNQSTCVIEKLTKLASESMHIYLFHHSRLKTPKSNRKVLFTKNMDKLALGMVRKGYAKPKPSNLYKISIAEDLPSLIYPMYLSPPSSYSNKITPNLFLL